MPTMADLLRCVALIHPFAPNGDDPVRQGRFSFSAGAAVSSYAVTT
jgi:hypothetical protein